MLIVELLPGFGREHFIKGKTIKEIARDLKVSRNTVRKVLRSGETSFEYERGVSRGRRANPKAELTAPNWARTGINSCSLWPVQVSIPNSALSRAGSSKIAGRRAKSCKWRRGRDPNHR